MRILLFLRLYRFDVAFISFLLFISGYSLNSPIDQKAIIHAFFISFFPFNFIYSINSWSDREADRINKPDRVIPSGKLSPSTSLLYCIFLFFISIIISLLFFNKYFYFFNLLLLIMGILYSVKPFYFKKNIILAHISMIIMYFTAIYSGSVLSSGSFYIPDVIFLITVYLSILIPLKDVTDIKGDNIINSGNWVTRFGMKNIRLFSFCSFIVSGIISYIFLKDKTESIFFALHCLISSFLLYFSMKKNIYRNILYSIIISLLLYLSVTEFMLT